MLTVTRFGRGVDPNGVERSSERQRYVSKHSIVPNGSTASARSIEESTMTQGTAGPVARESPREACAPSSRLIRGGGRFWLVLVAVAVVAGAAFNWSWLVAIGVAPLLLTLLPCLTVARVSVRGRPVTRRNMRLADQSSLTRSHGGS